MPLTDFVNDYRCRATLGPIVFVPTASITPPDPPSSEGLANFDWLGAYLGVGGLILFNFVWNLAPSVGWIKPYEYSILLVSVIHMIPFVFRLLTIRNWTSLLSSAALILLTVLGAVAAILSAWLIPRTLARHILVTGVLCVIVSTILVVTIPELQSYWPQLVPATILMTFCPDFIFSAAQILASNSVKPEHQGIAGSLIGTIISYGQSMGLGFAGTMEKYTSSENSDLVDGYRHALFFGIGLGGVALIIDLIFV
ncbi:hypothetical protein BDP55DRAFT_716923 [Colletotrichum godetiae]|uniref:Integral membrane protein n=1 Tax=Colletotrichum godetiae TaxID=1209918 RepID=A0AAJ0AHL3_9PEZI|nr:uncharacterized protein BDP55DRAFT_716923 [Colletotrichum godetiae]KAK1674043.1 hypothetical protein BDP55DRAFT_716923 [Colletotrichum godetiae]